MALPAKAAFLVTFQTEMSWAKEFAKLNIDRMSETDATFQVPTVPSNVDADWNRLAIVETDATFQPPMSAVNLSAAENEPAMLATDAVFQLEMF